MVNWYVSISGNDTTGNGTLANPYLTITKAIDVAVNGDIILVMDGTHNYSSTITVPKQLTIKSQNNKTLSILNKTNGGDFFRIQSNNVVISDLTIQASATNTADALITIDRNSSGTTLPTKYSNISILNNNLKIYKYAVNVNGANITITGNTISRNGGTERLTLFLIYYIRGVVNISNNTHTDILRTQRFIYLSSVGTSGSPYFDRVNSRGGTLICNNNTIDTSANTTQKPQMFIQDGYQTYNFGPVGPDCDYNDKTKLEIIMQNNNMIGNPTTRCDFFIPFLTSATNLNTYSSVTLQNNIVSDSDVGLVKLDALSTLTIDASSINIMFLFYIFNNTITNFVLRPDYTGNERMSQQITRILPSNIYLLENKNFYSDIVPSAPCFSFETLKKIITMNKDKTHMAIIESPLEEKKIYNCYIENFGYGDFTEDHPFIYNNKIYKFKDLINICEDIKEIKEINNIEKVYNIIGHTDSLNEKNIFFINENIKMVGGSLNINIDQEYFENKIESIKKNKDINNLIKC
jgi:hypothetical protein